MSLTQFYLFFVSLLLLTGYSMAQNVVNLVQAEQERQWEALGRVLQ